MPIQIDDAKYRSLHDAFLQKMKDESNGIPFTNFRHQVLLEGEIRYKWGVSVNGEAALQLQKWQSWRKTPGKVIDAVKAACDPKVSQGFLHHRHGMDNSSESPLYRVTTDEEKGLLEDRLFALYDCRTSLDDFGREFDNLADHVRGNSLGCNWTFFAYLAFILLPEKCFPILPSQFDKLLKFYGVNRTVSGKVTWERYVILLDLADTLKERLAAYAPSDAIDVQSYIYVVSGIVIEGDSLDGPPTEIDFAKALASRQRSAQERERIGLAGERLVYDRERKKLTDGGRSDLAQKVRLVSEDGTGDGYDLLSFDIDDGELHIEVKTTVRSHDQDFGFWLTDNEVECAKADGKWRLVRVWEIDSNPQYEDLGNVVTSPPDGWALNPSSWICRPATD